MLRWRPVSPLPSRDKPPSFLVGGVTKKWSRVDGDRGSRKGRKGQISPSQRKKALPRERGRKEPFSLSKLHACLSAAHCAASLAAQAPSEGRKRNLCALWDGGRKKEEEEDGLGKRLHWWCAPPLCSSPLLLLLLPLFQTKRDRPSRRFPPPPFLLCLSLPSSSPSHCLVVFASLSPPPPSFPPRALSPLPSIKVGDRQTERPFYNNEIFFLFSY